MNRRHGHDEFSKGEAELWGEAAAGLVNEVVKWDPDDPWTRLFLVILLTMGPRYAPGFGKGLYHKMRGTRPPSRAHHQEEAHQVEEDDQEAHQEADDQEEDDHLPRGEKRELGPLPGSVPPWGGTRAREA